MSCQLCWRGRERLHAQEACPLGKDMKPSSRVPLSVCLQILQLTRYMPLRTLSPSPPTMKSSSLSKSGSHLAIKSGRGLPKSSFMPFVISNVAARVNPRPIQPVFHSQNFLLHTKPFGVPLETVGPGIRVKQMMKIMRAGAANPTMTSTYVLTVSGSVCGNESVGSARLNGLWFGEIFVRRAATMAMILLSVSASNSREARTNRTLYKPNRRRRRRKASWRRPS